MPDYMEEARHVVKMVRGLGVDNESELVPGLQSYLARTVEASKPDRVSMADAQEAVYSAAAALAAKIGAGDLPGEVAKQVAEALGHVGSAVAKATWGEYGFSDQQTITDYRYTSFNGGKVGDAQRPAGFSAGHAPFVPPTTPEERL